jgi:hypothetical protein
MPGQRLNPLSKALRVARQVLDDTVLFVFYLALAILTVWHLGRFILSVIGHH